MHGKKREVLILNSGCSGHMKGNKSLLSEFEEKAGPAVSYGDGNLGQNLGYGNIEIGNVIIEKVALVSGLKHNLLSISQITYRGYHVNFMKEHCEIINKKTQKIVLTGYRHVNIYEVQLVINYRWTDHLFAEQGINIRKLDLAQEAILFKLQQLK